MIHGALISANVQTNALIIIIPVIYYFLREAANFLFLILSIVIYTVIFITGYSVHVSASFLDCRMLLRFSPITLDIKALSTTSLIIYNPQLL